jgi:hypothetical protein
MKIKYLNLILIFSLLLGSLMVASPARAEDPTWPPTPEGFWNEPAFPSIYDWIAFGLYPFAPDSWACHWDFGDGTSYDECWVNSSKQYSRDGDYTVSVLVTNKATTETVTYNRTVPVRTHDVTITRFTVPTSARAGQTRQLVVYISNTRYPESVQVELYRNDMVWVGTLKQNVPVRSANRTTAFNFTYTFTAEDARIGKVTFRAMAFILIDGGDDWPVDNDITAFPTRVSR